MKIGGLLSVALARGLLRVGVTHRFALWSPDFPRSSLEINLELQRGDPGDSFQSLIPHTYNYEIALDYCCFIGFLNSLRFFGARC